ncbi:MAG: V4R domain-containing protein [Anaerolineae bacterium]
MTNTILDNLQYDADKGCITFKDVRYFLIRAETIVDFQKAVEAVVGEKCAEMMAAGGYTGGALSSKRYKEVFGYSNEEIVSFMCGMGAEIGWGKFRLDKLDMETKEMIIEVQNSPFAEAYGPSDSGVCHMIRGVMAGMGAGIFGGDVQSEETRCVAKGDLVCRFEVRG